MARPGPPHRMSAKSGAQYRTYLSVRGGNAPASYRNVLSVLVHFYSNGEVLKEVLCGRNY